MFGRRENESLVNRRESSRIEYDGECRIQLDATSMRGKCMNISETGASIELRSLGNLENNQSIRFFIGYQPALTGRIRWTRGRSIGIHFTGADDNFKGLKALLAEIEAKG